MTLQEQSSQMLPAIEAELKRQLQRLDEPGSQPFHEMLAYHMGWTTDAVGTNAGGKRIRPLLVLLVVGACGAVWLRAAAPAAAIEILHNFSLVHDDIEDNSPTRRGRVTVWKRYGVPMAINIGDALFALSNLAVLDAAREYPPAVAVRAAQVLHGACLSLTRGQYLDMSYEKRSDITEADYWPMVDGKTAVLLSACAEIGAILGNAEPETIRSYASFGRDLGLAFQVQDDILGIWGDEQATGKSAASDLVEGKNSLPILYGIGRKGAFAHRWTSGPVTLAETAEVAQMLREEGAFEYCVQQAELLTARSMQSLYSAAPRGDAGEALVELAESLLHRRS